MNLNPFISGETKSFTRKFKSLSLLREFQTCFHDYFSLQPLITKATLDLTLTRFQRNVAELNKQQLPRSHACCGYLSQQCATRDSSSNLFLLFIFFARCVINFHRQTNTFCSADETENSFVFSPTTQLSYSGVSTIRLSTKPILSRKCFGEKTKPRTGYPSTSESFSERAFVPVCVFTRASSC